MGVSINTIANPTSIFTGQYLQTSSSEMPHVKRLVTHNMPYSWIPWAKILELRIYFVVLCSMACWMLASCGNESPTKPQPQTPTSIELSPEEATLTAVGDSIQLAATVLDQGGKVITGAVVTWTSSNASVVKVDARGLATALTSGYVHITAASGIAAATASIIVAQASSRIEIMPASPTLSASGETIQLSYTVYDSNGEVIPGAGVLWSSADFAVATVSATGLVTAVGNGITGIMASSGNASETIIVTVEID